MKKLKIYFVAIKDDHIKSLYDQLQKNRNALYYDNETQTICKQTEKLFDEAFDISNKNKNFKELKKDLNDIEINDSNNNRKVEIINDNIEEADLIMMYLPTNIINNDFFYSFAHSKFRRYKTNENKNYNPKPIIFVTKENIFYNYQFSGKIILNKDKLKEEISKRYSKWRELDKRKYFLDSSIWHYYLPLERWNDKNYKENLKVILQDIIINKNSSLYDINLSRMFVEFQTRIMKHAYLERMGGGENKFIIPFVFHTETEMKIKAKTEIERINRNYKNAEIKWNIIVVDDYAEPDNKLLIGKKIKGKKSKGQIVEEHLDWINNCLNELPNNNTKLIFNVNYTPNKNILKYLFLKMKYGEIIGEFIYLLDLEKELIDSNNDFNLEKISDYFKKLNQEKQNEIVEKINKLINEHKGLEKVDREKIINYLFDKKKNIIKRKISKQFDIIFLDYLLGYKSGNQRELGSELFTSKYKDLANYKGPLGKHWIFPMTAYTKAMRDKIRAMGIGHIHDDWYLFEGADPINTPYLFRYKLLRLIKLQLEQAIVTRKQMISFVGKNFSTSSDFENNDVIGSLRNKSRQIYGLFMHKFGLKDALKVDRRKGSVFADSVIKYVDEYHFNDKRCYENLRRLIYLIGYGTKQDIFRMWNLYTSIRRNFPYELYETKQEEANAFFKAVEKYINELSKS